MFVTYNFLLIMHLQDLTESKNPSQPSTVWEGLLPLIVIPPDPIKDQVVSLLRTQIYSSQCVGFVFASFGDPPGIRTPDPLLKRQLLCQLS